MRLIDKKILDPTLVELIAKHLDKPAYVIRHHIKKQKNPIWKTKKALTDAINKVEKRTKTEKYSILDLFANNDELWEES